MCWHWGGAVGSRWCHGHGPYLALDAGVLISPTVALPMPVYRVKWSGIGAGFGAGVERHWFEIRTTGSGGGPR